jgi:uncharacterized membrane protein YgcG
MMRISDEHVRVASAQKLRREYETLMFCDSEGVEDFAMRLAGIINQLATLGDPEPDDKVVLKYLLIARPRYKQLVLSIETLLDVSTLTIEEVTGWLKAVEDDGDEPPPPPAVEGKLLLTEEEWCERNKKKEAGDGSRSGSNGGRGNGGRGGGGHGRGGGRGDGVSASGGRGNNNCHRCGRPGHWPVNAGASNPRRMNMLLQPKRRTWLSCLLRMSS